MGDCPVYVRTGNVTLGDSPSGGDVSERFNLGASIASTQSAAAISYLKALSSVFADATMPDTNIPYDFGSISQMPISPPEVPVLSVDPVESPTMGELISISIPTITIPPYTVIEPDTVDIGYNEATYQSDIQDALIAALVEFIENGGTGINVDIEAALWERGRGRQAVLNERLHNEANNYMASRGYNLPACVLTGLLSESLLEQNRADVQLEYEISIEQARLERAQSDYSIHAGVTLEGQEKEHFNNIANRTLDCAKAAVQVIIDLYLAKLDAYIIKVEAARVSAGIAKVQADAVAASNENVIDVYKADIEGYKAKLEVETGIAEAIAKVYGFEVMGYEAEAKAAMLDLDAQVKEYQGRIDQAKNETALSLQEAEMAIQSYLGALQLTTTTKSAEGRIYAQWLAAALGMANASASLGESVSRAATCTESYTGTNARSDRFSEIHSYNETG